MKTRLLLSLLFLLPFWGADEWKPLFNGRNLDGWATVDKQGEGGFAVNNGAIETGPGRGMLWYTKEKIGNATLRVVYRVSNGMANSGIFIRIPVEPKTERDAIHKGIEVQIDDRDDDWHRTGVLYSMTKAMAKPSKQPGEWNTFEITLDGPRTIVMLNGVLVTDYDGTTAPPARTKDYEPERGSRPEYGYIALQKHDDRAVVSFREISVKPLKK